jgi:hypothetical protein
MLACVPSNNIAWLLKQFADCRSLPWCALQRRGVHGVLRAEHSPEERDEGSKGLLTEAAPGSNSSSTSSNVSAADQTAAVSSRDDNTLHG